MGDSSNMTLLEMAKIATKDKEIMEYYAENSELMKAMPWESTPGGITIIDGKVTKIDGRDVT